MIEGNNVQNSNPQTNFKIIDCVEMDIMMAKQWFMTKNRPNVHHCEKYATLWL